MVCRLWCWKKASGGGRAEDALNTLGMSRMEKIKNEYNRGTAQAEQFGEKVRDARPRWFGHM